MAVILKYRDPLTGKAHTTNHQPGKTADKKHREREKKRKLGGRARWDRQLTKARHTPIASGMFQKWYKKRQNSISDLNLFLKTSIYCIRFFISAISSSISTRFSYLKL